MLQKTYNLFDFLMRHSFHYWIWTFCALFIIFDKILHMPLELLSHFNFIPEFILNLSKIINTKPDDIADIVPNVNVAVDNKEVILVLNKIDQSIVGLTNGITDLNIKLSENNDLVQSHINTLLELSRVYYNNNQLLQDTVISTLQEVNLSIKTDTKAQIEIAKRLMSALNASNSILATIDTNIANINIPIVNIQDSLNNILNTQKEFTSMCQNTQNLNLQNFNSIIEMQNLGFNAINDNINEIFGKIHEVRNHNLGLYQQLTKSFDVKLLEQQTEIVSQIAEEINRPKTSSTHAVTKSNSWSNIFDKKN